MKYTIFFNFSTTRIGRYGNIIGKSGKAECDITVENVTQQELENDKEGLKKIALLSLKDIPKLRTAGKIEVTEITDLQPAAN